MCSNDHTNFNLALIQANHLSNMSLITVPVYKGDKTEYSTVITEAYLSWLILRVE